MRTPRLWRRSLARGAQWRLLLLWICGAALPAAFFALPLARYLGQQLDRSPRAQDLVAALDFGTIVDLAKQLETGDAALGAGASAALVGALLVAPVLAGAALTAARSQQKLRFAPLLSGAGELYGRMLRMALVSLLPLGLAGGLAFAARRIATKAAERAIFESTADRAALIAFASAALALFLARLTVDAGRAHLAAEPHRRSAFLAWLSGAQLVARRPLQSLGLGLATMLCGALVAWALLLLRLRLHQTGVASVLVAFLLAQAAVAAIGWDRASRLIGFAELVRSDAAGRARLPAAPAGPAVTVISVRPSTG